MPRLWIWFPGNKQRDKIHSLNAHETLSYNKWLIENACNFLTFNFCLPNIPFLFSFFLFLHWKEKNALGRSCFFNTHSRRLSCRCHCNDGLWNPELYTAPVRGGVMLSWLLWFSSSQASEITEANGTNFLTLRGEHIWVISSPSLPIGNKLTNKPSIINVHQPVCDICIVCSTLQTDAQVIKCGVLR